MTHPAGTPPARAGTPQGPADAPALRYQRIALVDLLDRVLAGGVVISGEIRLSIADVDLISISLRALISSVSTLAEHSGGAADRQGGAGHDDR
jgi:Gas vesicle protein